MITLVKKILTDGSECSKCKEVTNFLKDRGYLNKIDKIIFADPNEPNGEGMKLVKLLNMKRAPFFVVEEQGRTAVYSSVMELIKKEFK